MLLQLVDVKEHQVMYIRNAWYNGSMHNINDQNKNKWNAKFASLKSFMIEKQYHSFKSIVKI